MRQRFGVAVALLGNPKLIIVDEPTAGLDPGERVRFLNLLSELGEDAVVILSTHIVDDVSELCGRLAIIDKGAILLEAEPLRAVAAIQGRIWRRIIQKTELPELQRAHSVISTKLLAGRTVVHVHGVASPGAGFDPVEADLEDVYFSAMAGHYEDPGKTRARRARGGFGAGGAMKLWEIFRFEIRHQSRRASTWICAALLLVLTYYMTREIYIDNARNQGYLFNGPFVIATMAFLGSMVGLLIASSVTGDAAARDVQARIAPLLYTTPVTKAEHLGGRFLAAFSLFALVLVAVPLGLLLAAIVPGPDADLLGPLRRDAYLAAYLVLLLPNAFVATAVMFSLATLNRRAIVSYLGGVLLFAACVFSRTFVAGTLGRWELATLLDPLGLTALSKLSMTWTPVEKSTLLVGLQGSLVWNRIVWIGIAVAVLAMTHARFRLAHYAAGSRRRRRARPAEREDAPIPGAPAHVAPRVQRTFGIATHMRQALAVARESLQTIVTSWGAMALAVMAAALVVASGTQIEHMGVPLVATSARTVRLLSDRLTNPQEVMSLMVPLLVVFFAGELVWREREARLSEIADAAPVPDWVSALGKFVGLSLALVAVQALLMGAGLLIQVLQGHYDFELALYGRVLFGLQLPDYVLFALLALVVHVLVNNKYVGHLVVVMAYLFMAFGSLVGVRHHLLVYGSDPGWMYSDIRGFEPFIGPWLWFKLYWAAWALLLAVATTLFWVRGKEADVISRLAFARRRLTRRTGRVAAAAVALVLASGGFIFYNTNVLNAYRTASDGVARRAEYERRYEQYKEIPQPRLTGTNLRIEIYPDRREVEIRGTFNLVNTSAEAIGAVHLATSSAVETKNIRFDRPAKDVLADAELGHSIYALETPLAAWRIAAARFRGVLQAARVLERRDRSLRRRERHVFQNQRVAAGDRLSGGPRARRCRRAARARTRRASRDALFRRREGTSRCTTVRSSRLRGGGRHGRGAGGGGARTIAPGLDRERTALLPLRDRRADPE